jgi:membrane-associated phospholipid phosphatase
MGPVAPDGGEMAIEPARLDDAPGRQPRLPRPAWPFVSVVTACVAAFAVFSIDITHQGPLDRFDQRVARWAVDLSAGVHQWSWRLTHLGDAWNLAALILFVVAFLLWRRRRLDAILLCAAASTTGLLTTALKVAFARSRPPFGFQEQQLRSFSYPSGHSSGAFAVYLLLALILSSGLARRWRIAAVAAGLGVAFVVALSRVLIPVHYLTDVFAGSVIGIAVAVAAWAVRDALRPLDG